MTFERAIQILELNINYDNQSLVKAYRTKAKQYHPDMHQGMFENEMKQVNAAYEFLNKNYPNGKKSGINFNNQAKDLGFVFYRLEILQKMDIYVKNINKLQKHPLYTQIFSISLTAVEILKKYSSLINNSQRIVDIDSYFESFKREIASKLKELETLYLNYYSYMKTKKFPIHYDVSIFEFVSNLDQVREMLVKEIISELEIHCKNKFSLYVGYDDIKGNISLILVKYAESIMRTYDDKDGFIIDMEEEIESLFAKSFENPRRREKIKELQDYVIGMDSVILKSRIDNLSKEIGRDDFYDELDYLFNEAKSIKEGTYVSNIRTSLVEKATEVLRNTEDLEKTGIILDILKKCVFLLSLRNDGILNHDILSYLYGIKFEDLESDKKVLDFVSNKSNLVNPGYIYVSMNSYTPKEAFSYIHIDEKSGGYEMSYNASYGLSSTRKSVKHLESSADVSQSFISLAMYLANAEFIGKKGINNYSTEVSLLYLYKNRYLAMKKDGKMYFLGKNGTRIKSKSVEDELKMYEDRKLVLEKVSEMIDDEFIACRGQKKA